MKEQSVKNLSERLTAIFHRIEGVEFAYLFGSFARGDEFLFSDIDVAVFISEGIDKSERFDLRLRLSNELSSIMNRMVDSSY